MRLNVFRSSSIFHFIYLSGYSTILKRSNGQLDQILYYNCLSIFKVQIARLNSASIGSEKNVSAIVHLSFHLDKNTFIQITSSKLIFVFI